MGGIAPHQKELMLMVPVQVAQVSPVMQPQLLLESQLTPKLLTVVRILVLVMLLLLLLLTLSILLGAQTSTMALLGVCQM